MYQIDEEDYDQTGDYIEHIYYYDNNNNLKYIPFYEYELDENYAEINCDIKFSIINNYLHDIERYIYHEYNCDTKYNHHITTANIKIYFKEIDSKKYIHNTDECALTIIDINSNSFAFSKNKYCFNFLNGSQYSSKQDYFLEKIKKL